MGCRPARRVRWVAIMFMSWGLLGAGPAGAQPRPTPPVRVNSDPAGTRQVEPWVAIAPSDPAHLVLVAEESDNRDDATTRVRVFLSDDGGQTWRSPGLLPGDRSRQANPSVSYCADGVVWAALQDVNPGIAFQTYRSLDGGATWEKRTPAQQANSALDNPLLVCDDSSGPFSGRLYVRYGSVGKIYVVYSSDAGLSWSAPTRVDAGGSFTSNYPGEMTVGPDGSLWVGWVKNTSPEAIQTAVSSDGGVSFDPPQTVGPVSLVPGSPTVDYRRTSRPSLDVDASGGAFAGGLHLVFGNWEGNESDVKYSRRPPGPGSWSPPVRLNDDPPGNGKDQDFPSLRIDPLGVVRVIWLDHRNDPGDGSVEVYAMTSRDFGSSFEPSYPVSTDPFPVPTGSGAFLGDHLGIAVWRHVFLAVWPDRNRDDGDLLAANVRDFPFEEVSGVTVRRLPATRISWNSQDATYGPATVYDLVSGSLADLRRDRGFASAGCLAEDVPDTPYEDTRSDPPPGDGYYYLVRSQQGTDEGSHGQSTAPPDRRIRLDVAPACQ